MKFRLAAIGAIALIGLSRAPLIAQTRVFVVRLGTDTFAVERVTETPDSVVGLVVRHTPTTSILRYTLRFGRDSAIAYYAEGVFTAEGAPVAPVSGVDQAKLEMTITGDSVERHLLINGRREVHGTRYPGLLIPAIGQTSPYYQEVALRFVRRQKGAEFGLINFNPNQRTPATFSVRFVGADSAEILLGQGFLRGYRFDQRGKLLHGDAANTTVRLDIKPGPDTDLQGIARAWAAADAAGRGMGMASWRDTARAKVGSANISIDYGRPAKRGRVIWGGLVPLDTVWRLGANTPTILDTDADIRVGGHLIRAGSYSLWLVPSNRKPFLLVNRQTSGWVGVPMHDGSQDLDSIPIAPLAKVTTREERFRLAVQKGKLVMLWDDRGYDVDIGIP